MVLLAIVHSSKKSFEYFYQCQYQHSQLEEGLKVRTEVAWGPQITNPALEKYTQVTATGGQRHW